MPTHNRQSTALDTFKILYNAYNQVGFDVECLCIDSSTTPSSQLDDLPFLEYFSCPGLSLQEKFEVAKNFIKSLSDISDLIILWTTDDDLFLPCPELLSFCASKRNIQSRFIIPFRYFFFSKSSDLPNGISIQEKWQHHTHISSLSLTPIDRLEKFVSTGVNSCWGLFSVALFIDICELTSSLVQVLDRSHFILIEDLWNILILSAEWINLNKFPICFRGDDKIYTSDPDWIPSWHVWKLAQNTKQALFISKILLKFLCRIYPFNSIYTEKDAFLLAYKLITDHTVGYKRANSRYYGSGIYLHLPSVPNKSVNHTTPILYASKTLNGSINILLPYKNLDIDHIIYPEGHPLASAEVIQYIYSYRQFLCAGRPGL